MSKRCQMSNSQTSGLRRRFTKKINWHNEVHRHWRQFWRQIWRSSKLPKNTFYEYLRVFSDHHFWCQNWHQYLWTSLCQFNFFVNLLHSVGVSFFDIWHFFDNLTFFWPLDIFLIFWEQITYGPHCPYPCTPLPMYPIAHMAHTLCTPYPLCPYCPCAPYPCTPYPQWALLPICPIPLYPIAHVTHCHVAHTHCTP